MEKLQKAIFYEICKYLQFYEMVRLRLTCKSLRNQVKYAIIILSEREANSILLPTDNSTRNLFIVKEKPKEVLANKEWYEFLKEQLKNRANIKHRLYHVVPYLFPDIEKASRIKLVTFMFSEIKRKRKMDISMKKIEKHSGVAFTAFQDLVYTHSKGKLSDKYPKLIDTSDPKWSADEVIENNEVELFKLFREYRNSDANCSAEPKSPVLAYLYLFDKFWDSHCRTVARSIVSKWNNETFLDEYNTRWQSYVSLIQIFETDLNFLAVIMNELTEQDQLGKFYEYENDIPIVKFSLMRFMSRNWGRNVMKALFPSFKEKICDLVKDYQTKLFKLADEFNKESQRKNFHLYMRREYSLDEISYDIIKQGLLSILDMSVTELNVRMLNNSLLPIETFYLHMEDSIIEVTKTFMHDLFKQYPVKTFTVVSQLYCECLGEVGIKRTQRRLNSYVYAWIRSTIESKICKNFARYMMGANRAPTIQEVKEEDEDDASSPSVSPVEKKTSSETLKMKIKHYSTQNEKEIDRDISKKDYAIAEKVENVIKSTSQFKKLQNKKNTINEETKNEEPHPGVDFREIEDFLMNKPSEERENMFDDIGPANPNRNRNTLGVSKWVSSGNILKGHNLEKIKKVSTWLKDVQKIVDFYNKRDTSELFEALEIFTGKWVEGVEKFTKSDKKDKYLNGYKVDENASPLLYPQLNIVKENTTDPYDIYKKNTTLTLNLSYSESNEGSESSNSAYIKGFPEMRMQKMLTCKTEDWDFWEAVNYKLPDDSLYFQEEVEDNDMYDLDSDSFDLDDI